jgi:hypothetical protein
MVVLVLAWSIHRKHVAEEEEEVESVGLEKTI